MNESPLNLNQSVIPLGLKWAYTAFMLVLIPVYWRSYGPANFLFFCDVALFMTWLALWRESRWLTSLAAVGIVLPQLIWIVDFLFNLVGVPLLGITDYMLNPDIAWFTRGLSLFHFWLPMLLLWMLWPVYRYHTVRWILLLNMEEVLLT